jgi:processive 1,2-diacylglycerol beta-glucosyltransferase
MKFAKPILIYGFVDNMDDFMDAADIIITKPGGITTSESLAKRLPMILTTPIPGHEERNAEFLQNNGVAMRATTTFPTDEALFSFFSSKNKQKMMAKIAESLGKPNSAANLCEFLQSKAYDNLRS